MDPQAGSSFIPKKPLAGDSGPGFNGLFFSIALLAFLASLAAAGAAFGYKQYLTTAIASKDESLSKTQDAFDPDAIETLVRTDKRIREMQGLMAKHTAPSAVFALLSEITLGTVQYRTFAYETDAAGKTVIELTGIADSFSSVALQSDQFGASKHLSEIVFSGITINQTGKVDFTVSATVEPAALSYSRVVLENVNAWPDNAPEEPAAQPQPAATSSSATTTTP